MTGRRATGEAAGSDLEPVHFAIPDVDESDIAAVTAVLRSRWLTTGQEAHGFEDDLASYLQVPHVVTTSSCTTALQAAVAALHLPPGSRVAVPAWTFVSTVSILIHLGLTPVLVDADPTTLNLSASSFDAALRSGVAAAVVVHFAGTPVAAEIFDAAARAGIPVVEDCAHAIGTDLAVHEASVAQCFSFYVTKNLSTGEGGALATRDPEIAAFARTYRLHGMTADAWRRYLPGGTASYDVLEPGIKANLPDLLAALGRSQLRRFPQLQARRRELVTAYRRRLAEMPELTCVPVLPDAASADHLMVVLLADGIDRDPLVAGMRDAGISTSVHFRPVHHLSGLRPRVEVADTLAVCDALAPRALSLPLHPGLTVADVDRVVDALAAGLAVQARTAPVAVSA